MLLFIFAVNDPCNICSQPTPPPQPPRPGCTVFHQAGLRECAFSVFQMTLSTVTQLRGPDHHTHLCVVTGGDNCGEN